MPISLGKIILASGKALAVFIALNIIYYLIFKTKRKHFLFIRLKDKTRLWFYLLIIFLSSFYFVNSLPDFNAQFKILNFFYYSILILFSIVIIEGLSIFSFDYLIIFKKQADFPLIFKDLIKSLVYLTLILFFLGGILKINITPLITTSAIFSIILGLALQETLGNLFSGLTLHLSKPYKIGDWIKVENYEGIVERIDWRSTSIKTFSWDYITIPNSKLSKIEIHNYSTPSILHATYIEVGTHYRHSPDKIKKILTSCAKTTKGIAQDPSPIVYLTQYGDFAINYQLRFWIKDYSEILDIKAEIMEKIWYYFKREEIEISASRKPGRAKKQVN
ncbi:MAG: mechanosensitive ion channel family protein [Armatimonadetes bacterium]|nr:mechanosensitive ion channel family protein [Armatimonadota bacterium]